MNRRQLEMRFEESPSQCRSTRPRRRLTRARWWFQQMRLVVDQTPEWESASRPSLRTTDDNR
jgi:hypothetical protein